MYTIRFEGMKPLNGSHTRAIVAHGDGWYTVDPMRFERYAAGSEVKQQRRAVVQEKRAEASRSYVFQPARPQVSTRPAPRKSGGNGRKQTVHSKSRFLSASVMTDSGAPPVAGELIQPLRGREWVSEFWVPLAQAGITGILVAGGTGIALAISTELLETVRAGIVEFSVIGGAGWLWGITRRLRHYEAVDALVEAMPFGFLVGIGSAVYYLTVTGNWFTFGWGAAISGMMGFTALAAQWGGFLGRADDLLYAIERMTAVDIDGDGEIGRVPVEPNGVRRIPGSRGGKPFDEELTNQLPVNSHVMRSFAVAVLCDNCHISRNAICDHTKQDFYKWDKISQGDYSKIYDYLRKARFINEDTNKLVAAGWDELSRWIPDNFQPNLDRPTP